MLRVSTRLDYGVKAMVRLASTYETGPVALSWVANEERISMAYLEQLVIPLKSNGLVIGTRGAKGGYRLSRSPSDITVADVVEALEGPFVPYFCVESADEHRESCCAFEVNCSTRNVWVKVRDQVNTTLRGVTLGDLYLEESRSFMAPSVIGSGPRPIGLAPVV